MQHANCLAVYSQGLSAPSPGGPRPATDLSQEPQHRNEVVDAQPVDSPAAARENQVVADAARVSEPEVRQGRRRKLGSNLNAPELYLNRELTWLAFNQRVLHEAEDERTPLLERVKFLAIVSSNLDEFFMKRIGGLKQQQAAGIRQRTVDGRSPEEQIQAFNDIHDRLLMAGLMDR